mmetsp:Transcript_72608/g.216737  ORF Transcript_72608/g.216737 Transcript_72608/m.216737 type:complete len:232 (-) Transcript_72608:866-1561(-)
MSKLITCWMAGKSRPLEATSVPMSTSFVPSLKDLMASCRSSWSRLPWIATASTPLRRRYSWTSSTSDLFSQKMSTGGGVFWRHVSRYTSLASCFTYSTSWMTSKLAAPARPTLMTIGSTSAVFAKSWIFRGMVALKRSVCRCPRKWSRVFRISSSKPRSTMRSASSMTRYRHCAMDSLFLFNKSLRRPGVATTMCDPLRSAMACVPVLRPPMVSTVLSLAKLEWCCTSWSV